MRIPVTPSELAGFLNDGIQPYSTTLCMTLEEGRGWQEAEENFRHMLTVRIAEAIVIAVQRGVAPDKQSQRA